MIRKSIFLFLLIFFLFILNNQVLAQQKNVDIFFFYGQGCPHCARAEEFLRTLKKEYPNLTIKKFEVYFHQENRNIYFILANAYKINVAETPVPVIFIGDKSFIGYNDYIGSQIRNEVLRCLNQKCLSPIERIQTKQNNQNTDNRVNSKQIIVGWIVIGLIILVIIFLLLKFVIHKKRNF